MGRTPRYGYHLDSERLADVVIEVRCPLREVADFGTLDYVVGKQVGSDCLWFDNLADFLPPLPEDVTEGGDAGDRLKTLGAGLAAYRRGDALSRRRLHARSPRPGRSAGLSRALAVWWLTAWTRPIASWMPTPELRQINLVTVGCPHASLNEIRQIADTFRQANIWRRSFG